MRGKKQNIDDSGRTLSIDDEHWRMGVIEYLARSMFQQEQPYYKDVLFIETRFICH